MNKTFGRKLKQGIGILLAAAVVFNMLPLGGLAVSASENSGTGICEHHTEHTEDCGYAEAEDCRHEHTEECYTAEGELDCHHEHDEDCGYAKAHECTYVCEICNNEASGEEDAEDDDAETTEENSGNTYECICKELCTEDNIEKDCPVCGVEDADFSSCKGKEMEDIEDVETEDRDFEDVNSEDTGLCEHHTEHTKDCGYSPASEDGEGSPCTYECRICPIEDLIAALPDEVTQDNAETVQAQLEEILSLYTELTEDEQEQIDLTLVYKLQADLDAANVRCEVNTNYIASVTVNGVETRYTSPESFVNAVKDASGTVTVELLQKEVDLGSLSLTVPSDVTLTLDGGECTLTSSDNATVIVDGTFNFKSGTLLNTNRFGTAVNVFGSFTMSGGVVDCANNIGFAVTFLQSISSGTITGGTVGVNNGGLAIIDGTVVLSGGTYSSIYYGVHASKPITVANILASGYALQGTDGLIRGDTSLSTILRNVTVVPCTHAGAGKDNGDGTHTLKCPYCGYTGMPENCSYGTAYQHDENSHLLTCTVCGYEKVETHTFSSYSVEENGSITFFGQCGKCKYDKVIGTAQLTIPQDLVYGQTGEKTISVETEMPYDKITLKLDWDGGEVENTSIDLPADLSAGRHSVYTSIYIEGVQNVSVVYFTVEKAPLTMDMVTLSPESVTYSGEEQKPTIAVKQGEAALVEGTDCDVICSTTDFTSAGTIIFTITGKGNYKGTVEKTYTIKKAVLTATGTGIANGTYGAKLSELSITGLTAVYPGTTTEVPGTWKLTGDTIPGVDDSGKYTAAFTPANGAGNYETLTAQVTLNIEKAAAPAPQKGTLYVQNNREQSYQYDLTQLLPALDNGKSYGTVKYALGENAVDISGDYYTDGAKVTGTTLTLPIQKIETDKEGNIGEVTITITSGNYKDMSAVINVESVDKIPVTITGVSVEEREYNGKAIDCIGTPRAVDSSGNTVTIDDKEYKYTWQTADGMVLSGAPKDAGSYLLIVSVNNDTYMGSSMISFVIDRASIIITADSKTVSKGSAKPALTYTISGLAAGEALAVEPTLTCNADMNTAGRYPINVSGGEVPNSNNYRTEITYIPGALTVTASASGGGSGSSGGGNSGGSGGNNNGNGSGSENNGDSGQGSSSDNGGVNTTPGVPTIPPVTDTNPGTGTDAVKPGTGNTVRPGTGTGAGSSAAQETMADTGIPFIKGEDGKIGWNVIRAEEEKAEEGTVINVDMNGTTVVPGDIFDSIKGRDVTITFDMGSGILWSVDGRSIIADKADDIDFTVRTGGSAVPVEIVNNVTGEHYSIQLSLAHDGEFGFTAVLSVNLGKENAGYTASLYYYNQNAGELEFMCADEVTEDGTVSFAFTHASDYVIVIDRISEEPAPESAGDITEAPAEEEGNSGEAVVSPKEIGKAQKSSMPWLILAGIAVVILGATGILIWKRKKEEGNREAK